MKKVLTLSPDTFLWTNEREGIVYDSKHHRAFEFEMTPPVLGICRQLQNYDNLYSAEYDDSAVDPSVASFIEGTVSIGAGMNHEKGRHIISLPPLLNIQHDIDMQKKRNFEYQDFALRYLSKIVIYTGGRCPENIFYQQTEYPINSETVLNYTEIRKFVKTIKSPYLLEIAVVFSDISGYDGLEELLEAFQGVASDITICIRVEEFVNDIPVMLAKYPKLRLRLLYHPGYKHHRPVSAGGNIKHMFLIASEYDYKNAEEASFQNHDYDIKLMPVFTGGNAEFLKDNVLLSKDDIMSSDLDRRGVFMHQVLNTNHFGTLYVMPDKKVYSDVTAPALGSMSDSIYGLILEELSKNYSWRRIRNTGECKNCLYRYLCPSPGVYEKLMEIECICTDKTL